MKARSTLIIIALILTLRIFCQDIVWARKDTGSFNKQHIICVKDSIMCLYGTRNNGSFLKSYTPQGSLTSEKTWPGNFFITGMIYNGGQYFYFTANYSGNVTVDGIPLIGKGGTDAVIGKMTVSGTVLWMSTIASNANETLQGLCFGLGNRSVIVTGKTTDSLIVNGTYITKNTKSVLLAQFNTSGGLLMSRLWDFLPQRDNFFGTAEGQENEGLSIRFTLGDYYLLTGREGKHPTCCSFDTLNARGEGFYIMKLNSNWDTLWTRYIISRECYYGFSLGDIAVTSNGDVYIPSRCNSHYGGTGILERLNQYTGATIWSDSHEDGGYSWAVAEGNTIHTCGTDSATYCPCPDQHEGFETLKRFDQLNAMTRIKKFNQAGYIKKGLDLHELARDGYGNTYVYGVHTSSLVVLGQDSIPGVQHAFTWFVMKLSDTTAISIRKVQAVSPFAFYPNPSVNGCFILNTEKLLGTALAINITSVDGKLVHNEIVPAGQKSTSININNCDRGVYILEVSNGRETWRDKLIIQ